MTLLRLQSEQIDEERFIRMFEECYQRIRSMALIHEKLYQSADLARVDMNEYMNMLASGLQTAYVPDSNHIKLHIESSNVSLPIDNAIPCGMVINELISNSLKHAFPKNRTGTIYISLSRIDADNIEIIVNDDGIGMNNSIDLNNPGTIGLRIVKMLVEHQLDGDLELNREKGTQFKILFKKSPLQI